ncbi:hypothetical protein [Chitinophaga sp. MM2321]|uniref:hypothetical protein n=1 Tax=Chitinophaga sp. MM2321 TaxID=3137178 RepID=UPI0032D59871
MNYDQLISKLQNRENFAFSRWGDGEFNCVLQTRPGKSNCDGNLYYPELGEALKEIINSTQPYYLGMQPLAKRLFPAVANEWLLNGSNWINADILHNASQEEGLDRLFDAVKGRMVLFIGPAYLHHICNMNDVIIDTGTANCWTNRDKILLDIGTILGGGHSDWIVFISAGMAANYFVDLLYNCYRELHTFIDAGSVFDPYCGVNSRKYHSHIIERINADKTSN